MSNLLRVATTPQHADLLPGTLRVFFSLWSYRHHRHRGFHSSFQAFLQSVFGVIQQQAPTNYMFFRNARHLETIFEGLYEHVFSSKQRLVELFWHYDAALFSANLLQSLCAVFAETIFRGNAIIMQHPLSLIHISEPTRRS